MRAKISRDIFIVKSLQIIPSILILTFLKKKIILNTFGQKKKEFKNKMNKFFF